MRPLLIYCLFIIAFSSIAQPVVNIGRDTLICNNITHTLDAGNPGSRYLWSTNETTQQITVFETGTYWVTVTNDEGSTTAQIEVRFLEEKYNRANYWFVGDKGAIEFDNGSTAPFPYDTQLNFPNGAASTTDGWGNLAMVSDGRHLYDKNGDIMENGDNILGDPTTPANTLLFPRPGSHVYYYAVTLHPQSGLHYSLINMRDNNGNGRVIEKNVPISQNIDKVTSVKAADGTNLWLIALNRNSNRFEAYMVNRNRITAPVVSETGPMIPQGGTIKVSPYGDKLAVTTGNTTEIYELSKTTGRLNHVTSLYTPGAYGIEFSRGNNHLFISSNTGIYKATVKPLASDTIRKSLTKPFNVPQGNDLGDIQLGIDGKLYVANNGKNCMGVISNPDSVPVFDLQGLCLNGASINKNLPQFPQHYFAFPLGAELLLSDTCVGEQIHIWGFSPLEESLYADVRYSYDLGDGNTHNGRDIWYTYNRPGTYWVTMTVTSSCNIDQSSEKIEILPKPVSLMVNDTSLCMGEELTLDPQAGDTIRHAWSDGTMGQTLNVNTTGTYWIELSNDQCTVFDTAKVLFHPLPVPIIPQRETICTEKDERVAISSQPFSNYLWLPLNSTDQTLDVDFTGIFTLVVTDSNGCIDSTHTIVEAYCEPLLLMPNAFSPNHDMVNDVFIPLAEFIFEYEMKIFDRWGELIFLSNEVDQGWDGTLHGQPAPSGAYVYLIEYKGSYDLPEQEKRTQRGNFLLIR